MKVPREDPLKVLTIQRAIVATKPAFYLVEVHGLSVVECSVFVTNAFDFNVGNFSHIFDVIGAKSLNLLSIVFLKLLQCIFVIKFHNF